MKILVIGDASQLEECRLKFSQHALTHRTTHDDCETLFDGHDLVFDFLIHTTPLQFRRYARKPVIVFANSIMTPLIELARAAEGSIDCTLFGFNGFPTMLGRDLLEVALLRREDETILNDVALKLETSVKIVDDRVGMVTPRVLCMIINEAYYAVQDGTATREDIDLAMKLGTNYPFGPFEWCQRVGLKSVYELLEALYNDTKDERFRVSALMKREYLAFRCGAQS